MNKTEICYKFFFPKYDSLSINPNEANFVPDSDGVDQLGEVRALCNACPERVITYDQLSEENPNNLILMYKTAWETDRPSTQPYQRSFIKGCIDKYLSIPKYFNLRNYWDANPCQEGGMSLMISHSPEIGSSPDYTKFTYDGKVVYCTVMISSGDFFSSFCLPNEAISKSGLKNEIVANKFHSNWYFADDYAKNVWRTIPRAVHFNNSDQVFLNNDPSKEVYIKDDVNYPGYPYADLNRFKQPTVYNPVTGTERRVFVQHYFHDFFQCSLQGGDTIITEPSKFNEDLKQDFLELEATRRILYYYNGTQLRNPDNNIVDITNTGDIPTLLDKCLMLDDYNLNYDLPPSIAQGSAWWYSEPGPDHDSHGNPIPEANQYNKSIQINMYNSTTNSWEEKTVYTKLAYQQYNCSELRNMARRVAKLIHENLNKIGKNTRISYEPPDVYRTDRGGCPPLQIPYNLLRYCLNDRPPFTDCETVLVMWVADSDPNNISDSAANKVQLLNGLHWQQYAIPISMRCYTKDNNTNTTRFLVLYPYAATDIADREYGFHYRRAEYYNKNVFKEAAYIQDLMKYSNDYIITYNHTSYFNHGFNIQKYLCTNTSNKFRVLYVKKAYSSALNKREFQTYYVKVDNPDNSVYHIDTSLSDRCFAAGASGSTSFMPSQSLTRANYEEKWDLIFTNEWLIRNDWFIALFDASDESIFLKRTGKLTLTNSSSLRSFLQSIYSYASWDDIYISSLGISPTDQTNDHFVKTLNPIYNSSNTGNYDNYNFKGNTVILPLGVLDGYIQINGTTYGSNTANHLAVIGLKDVFDYTHDDYHHFKYVSGAYQLTKGINNSYTAYVMQIT